MSAAKEFGTVGFAELIDNVVDQSGYDNNTVREVLETFGENVAGYLEEQMAVPLPAKLGRLKPRLRKARVGRNPRTGDDVDIPAHIAVKFQPSKSLRERLKKEKS